MRNIKEFADERQKSWCLHCTRPLVSLKTNRDHVPSKGLLNPPLPENLPVIEVCSDCNNGFAKDEEYFIAFLSAAVSGTTDPDKQSHATATRIFREQTSLRRRVDQSAQRYITLAGEEKVVWKPEQERIERVVVKNARGHAFYEYNEPMLERPTHVWAMPLLSLSPTERADFESVPSICGWPEVGSRMMTRVMTGEDLDGSWVKVQDGFYQYAVAQVGTLLVRSVIFNYLATEVYWE